MSLQQYHGRSTRVTRPRCRSVPRKSVLACCVDSKVTQPAHLGPGGGKSQPALPSAVVVQCGSRNSASAADDRPAHCGRPQGRLCCSTQGMAACVCVCRAQTGNHTPSESCLTGMRAAFLSRLRRVDAAPFLSSPIVGGASSLHVVCGMIHAARCEACRMLCMLLCCMLFMRHVVRCPFQVVHVGCRISCVSRCLPTGRCTAGCGHAKLYGPAVELHLAVERIGEDGVGREAAEVELVPVHHRHIEAATDRVSIYSMQHAACSTKNLPWWNHRRLQRSVSTDTIA